MNEKQKISKRELKRIKSSIIDLVQQAYLRGKIDALEELGGDKNGKKA